MLRPGVVLFLGIIITVCGIMFFMYRNHRSRHEITRLQRIESLDKVFSKDLTKYAFEGYDTMLASGSRFYNPGLFLMDNQLYLVPRSSTYHNCQHIVNIDRPVYNGIYIYTPNDHIIEVITPRTLEFKCANGYEDPRSFMLRDKLYLLATDPQYEKCVNQMKLLEIDRSIDFKSVETIEPKIIDLLYKPGKKMVQKNWMPFTKTINGKDELFFVYNVSPHTILHCEVETGECHRIYETSSEVPKSFRGGTPAKKIGDEYITFGHRKYAFDGAYVYTTFVYAFNAESPFQITRASPEFYLEPTIPELKKHSIQFVSGMEVMDGKVYISYGSQDCECKILSFTIDQLNGLMTPLAISSELSFACYVFIVTSVVNIEKGRNLSSFTSKERLEQTLHTIKSIKKHCPYSIIIVAEGSALSDEQYKILSTDVIMVGSSTSNISKQLGESMLILAAIKEIESRGLTFNLLFKISGRYELNDRFDISQHSMGKFNICVIEPDKNAMATTLYSVPFKYLDIYKRYLTNTQQTMDRKNIEVLLGRQIIPSENVNILKVIGVQGLGSREGKPVEH